MDRFLLHYGIHIFLPILAGWFFYRKHRIKAILVLLAGILIDLDHLLADPIFDACRCSIGYHPLHTYWAMAAYSLLFLFPKTRIFGLALMIHILADSVDCYLLLPQAE
jgi:hypothetical protein